jgi:hypothetical protein
MRSFSFLFLFVFGLISCKKPDPIKVVLPTDLTTNITVNNSSVQVVANAINANFYTITFYENNDSTVVESTTG